LGRLRQEDHKFQASLGYKVRPCGKEKRGREGRRRKKEGEGRREVERGGKGRGARCGATCL
jgi:hypothetical protein